MVRPCYSGTIHWTSNRALAHSYVVGTTRVPLLDTHRRQHKHRLHTAESSKTLV